MIQSTHKAIARAAGYRVKSSYSSYPNIGLKYDTYFTWHDTTTGDHDVDHGFNPKLTEAEAYKACCIACGLVIETSEDSQNEAGALHSYKPGDKVFLKPSEKVTTIVSNYGDSQYGLQGLMGLSKYGNYSVDDIEPYDPVKHAKYDVLSA